MFETSCQKSFYIATCISLSGQVFHFAPFHLIVKSVGRFLISQICQTALLIDSQDTLKGSQVHLKVKAPVSVWEHVEKTIFLTDLLQFWKPRFSSYLFYSNQWNLIVKVFLQSISEFGNLPCLSYLQCYTTKFIHLEHENYLILSERK